MPFFEQVALSVVGPKEFQSDYHENRSSLEGFSSGSRNGNAVKSMVWWWFVCLFHQFIVTPIDPIAHLPIYSSHLIYNPKYKKSC